MMSDFCKFNFGQLAYEVSNRLGELDTQLPVFGVERGVGLTETAKYQSKNLTRYKQITPGMFAYNPMRLNIGSIGYCTPTSGPGLVSPDYVVFDCRRELIHPEFLYYFIKSAKWQDWVSGAGIGSVRERIYFRNLAFMPIQIPDLRYQEVSVELLSVLDKEIDLNRRMNEVLESIVRLFFKDWFVDFGPTRAKAERLPPYLAPELWSLFPDALDYDDKPVGWKLMHFEDLAEQCKGSVSPADNPSRTFEHYSLPAFDKGQEPAHDLGETIKSNKTPVPEGVVLLSKLNPETSRVWIPNDPSDTPQIASTEFLVFKPKASSGRGILYCLFRDPSFKKMLEGMVTGTSKSHQRISPSALLVQETIYGSSSTFEAYEQVVSPFFSQMLANRAESRKLAQTRDLLLPKLMSGEIRLREAEKLVDQVA